MTPFEDIFPIWDKLTSEEQLQLASSTVQRRVAKGALLHGASADCLGLILVCSGQLRAYILSDEGKEITIYRLLKEDMCLFSASCMMKSIRFDVTIAVEKDAELWFIPVGVYKNLMEHSLAVANYTNELMASRFSEVMWLVEQIMWKRFDQRLAEFLLLESTLDESDTIHITHDKIAAHMGTAREVVTRMLRYFQSEGLLSLARGSIHLTDKERLAKLAK